MNMSYIRRWKGKTEQKTHNKWTPESHFTCKKSMEQQKQNGKGRVYQRKGGMMLY